MTSYKDFAQLAATLHPYEWVLNQDWTLDKENRLSFDLNHPSALIVFKKMRSDIIKINNILYNMKFLIHKNQSLEAYFVVLEVV